MTDITLEQRADRLFDAMMAAPYGNACIGDVVCAETTASRLRAAWLPLIEAALRLSAGADASQWRPIHELDPSDDLYWFTRGDTVDGPRESRHDDADYWDFFAPVKWPALPAAPRHEPGEG